MERNCLKMTVTIPDMPELEILNDATLRQETLEDEAQVVAAKPLAPRRTRGEAAALRCCTSKLADPRIVTVDDPVVGPF